MLKNIDPVLNADVLHALCAMGHGDTVILADMNFPSDAIARQTAIGKLLRMDNVSSVRAMEAILSVLPLDTPPALSVGRMEVIGNPDEVPIVQQEVQVIVQHAEASAMYSIERWKFYEEAKKSYCIIATGESRFYGCFKLTKGVIPPEEV